MTERKDRQAEPCPFYNVDCEYVPMAHRAVELENEIERLRGLLKKDPNVYMIAHEDGDHKRLSRALVKAHDEIERLWEDKEMWADATAKAQQEIERLREALNLIRVAIQNYGNGGKSEGFALGYVDEVARSALKGDE